DRDGARTIRREGAGRKRRARRTADMTTGLLVQPIELGAAEPAVAVAVGAREAVVAVGQVLVERDPAVAIGVELDEARIGRAPTLELGWHDRIAGGRVAGAEFPLTERAVAVGVEPVEGGGARGIHLRARDQAV